MDHCGKDNRKTNPRDRANIFSLLTFLYTGGLFRRAFKNDLEEKDLYEVIKSCNSKQNGDKFEELWEIENKKGVPPSITKLLWKRFGLKYTFLGLVHLVSKIFRTIVEPYAISNLVGCFAVGYDKINLFDIYYYSAIILLVNFCHTVYIHNYIIIVQKLSIKIRTSFSSLIYRKALKLSPSTLSEISLGNIVTLLTKDVLVFEQTIWMVNDMWIGMIQSCVVCFQLYYKLGVTSFVGLGILLGAMPIQAWLGTWVSKMRLTIGKKTDERLQMTQETLSAIKIIKLYTWELFFNNKVNEYRKKEVRSLMTAFYIKIIIVYLGIFCARVGFYLLIWVYIWRGFVADAKLIYYVTSLFKDLRHTLGVVIPVGMSRAAEIYAAVTRINKVLNAEELKKVHGTDEITLKPKISLKQVNVKIKNLQILKNISLNIDSGLTIVTGTVGSGKSSLIKTMLQDYPLDDGSLKTDGRISYASQEPWLFPSSIKQNILFGESLDETRYKEVLRVCALDYDLSLFDKGDETIIADKGINLSKGQQARINLARAVYKPSEIYLLDDSLTALDAHVQDFIFYECIKGFLKDKLIVLVTHSVSHLKEANSIVIIKNGEIQSFGNPEDVSIKDVAKLVGEDDDLEKDTIEETIIDEEEEENKEEYNKLLETEQVQAKKKVYHEINKKGSVNLTVYNKYFKFGGGLIIFAGIIIVFSLAQFAETYSDKLLSVWADWQEKSLKFENNTDILNHTETITLMNNTEGLNYTETITLGNNSEGLNYNETITQRDFTFNLYSGMIFICLGLNLLKQYILLDFCRRASLNLHKAMSNRIIHAIMSFFDKHFIGNILNRFSQDLNNIDEQLPSVFMECLRVSFSVGGIIIVTATLDWRFLIPTAVFLIILVIMRFLYMPTGRSLKRLEAATRSPIVGHLNSSLEGLTTIRAYKAEQILKDEFDRHQDLYTSAHFTMQCTMRAFGFFMDFLCSLFIGVVIGRFIYSQDGISAGDIGLALSQILMLAGHVQWGIRQWADLENQMTSVERTLEYTEIKQETKSGNKLENWPTEGCVQYQNVTLTYNNNEKVLKNINFTLEPRQKIGIVGRTGAGKSSIIATLFRLYEIEGKILIDGVDIKTLSLEFLRQSIAIIPQDPVLFSGTIRSNIDPKNIYTDDEIWTVLEKVKIKDSFVNLDFKINQSGSNFSSGQKQLICLARAIIRKNKIVVLDEATANMDPETDALLHNVIKDNFSNCTLFSIAHRLHTILDSDKVMVLDRGEIIEFDDPNSLLENKNGNFYKMVDQSGLMSMLS